MKMHIKGLQTVSIGLVVLGAMVCSAQAMVMHYDYSTSPLESSIGYTHSSTWQANYLNLELVPGEAWSQMAFGVKSRKYNYNTAYGTGTIWDGWIETNDATVTEASPGAWPSYIKKHPAGQSIDMTSSFVSDTSDKPRVVWRHYYTYPMGTFVGNESGGQFLDRSVYSPAPVGGYIGLKLTDDLGQDHYAWMRIETYITQSIVRLKVFEWAYEYNAGAPIIVGNGAPVQQPVNLDESINAALDNSNMVSVAGGLLNLYADPGTSATVNSVNQVASGSPGYSILGAYGEVMALLDIDISGLDTGESVSLMFDIADGLTDGIQVWHIDDAGLAELIDPSQWQYDGDTLILSNVTDFSQYGVTVVPEPASLGLLVVSSLALLRRAG
jgi:hypothetical protein